MKRITDVLLLGSLVVGSLGMAAAQEHTMSPPKVLTVTREFVKPGKGGAMHDKAESAFVQAYGRTKWPTHYLAMGSLSGKPRVLFFVGYDSFEAWEKDVNATNKNAALSGALDRASVADGELLDSMDQGAWAYREDYSLRAPADIPHMRYFDIAVFHVKPGHRKEWDDGMKMVLAAYEKLPETRWACYEAAYGAPQGTFAFITPRKSAAEIDRDFAQDKQFMAAMGDDGMKKLEELSAASIESSETNLFAFNPKMSYVSDDWVKADPDFWKPKPAAAPAAAPKKPAEKPGTGQ
jgi:hypothetical protein